MRKKEWIQDMENSNKKIKMANMELKTRIELLEAELQGLQMQLLNL